MILECGHAPSPVSGCGTGYATTPDGDRICYGCCAVADRAHMDAGRPIVLYLESDDGAPVLTNWPGTLRIPARVRRAARGCFGRGRVDVWCVHNGCTWHGHGGTDTQAFTMRPSRRS